MVILHIKGLGSIKIELDYNNAPISATNFAYLASTGFYNGVIFHRVIKNFMIQGGDPTGTGTSGPGYSIKGEFKANGVNNTLSHKRGVVSMARANNPNSGGSQFFICDKDDLFLDGQYAAFGKVIEGMDVVDAIASKQTDASDRPLQDVIIESAEVIDEKISKPETL